MRLDIHVTFGNLPDTGTAAALSAIKNELHQLTMTTTEAFEKIAQSDAQIQKGLGEVRTKIDAQTALIEQLQNTTLTPDQERIVTELSANAQALDDIVPDAPTA